MQDVQDSCCAGSSCEAAPAPGMAMKTVHMLQILTKHGRNSGFVVVTGLPETRTGLAGSLGEGHSWLHPCALPCQSLWRWQRALGECGWHVTLTAVEACTCRDASIARRCMTCFDGAG